MTTVDITLALLLAFSALRSYGRGLFGTLASFASPVLAFMVAGDWSDPVRDRLEGMIPAPDFVLDMLAPGLVFVAVIASVRLVATLLSRLLGVGMSVPSRLLASAIGGLLGAFGIGVLLVLLHSFAPPHDSSGAADHTEVPDAPGAVVSGPVSEFLARLDQHVAESVLGPALQALAESVLAEALPEHMDGLAAQLAPGAGNGPK